MFGGIVSHHLIVHGVLGASPHTSCASVQIVDEQRAHGTLLDDVRRLTVTLTDQLCRLTCIPRFKLTSRHHNGADPHLAIHQVTLECLPLTLATPNSKDEGNLDKNEREKKAL